MSHVEPASQRLWTDPLYEAVPLSPLAAGVIVASALVALLAGLAALGGQLEILEQRGIAWWQHRDGRLGVLLALMVGTLPTALRYHELGTRQNLRALLQADLWEGGPRPASERWTSSPKRALRFGLSGLLLLPAISFSIDRDPSLYLTREYWGLAQIWHWVMGSVCCFMGGVLTYRVLADARRFGEMARSLPRIDLLDRDGLLPFARQGLRSAVPGMILLTFLALNLGDRDFWLAIGSLGLYTAVQVAVFLWIPLRSLHQRIQAAKAEELARLRAAIRGDVGALRGSPLDGREPPSLSDLLAWRRFVESVPEWPIDASTLGHSALYLGIPLVSWVGAALVERLLDWAIR